MNLQVPELASVRARGYSSTDSQLVGNFQRSTADAADDGRTVAAGERIVDLTGAARAIQHLRLPLRAFLLSLAGVWVRHCWVGTVAQSEAGIRGTPGRTPAGRGISAGNCSPGFGAPCLVWNAFPRFSPIVCCWSLLWVMSVAAVRRQPVQIPLRGRRIRRRARQRQLRRPRQLQPQLRHRPRLTKIW